MANKRKREARKLKADTDPLSKEELKNKREENRKRKALSRLNQSRQKVIGTKLKDRNRKRKILEMEEHESTARVRKHRVLKVAFNFSSKKKKVDHVSQAINKSLSMLSPHSKVKAITQSCSKSLSPASKSSLTENVVEGASNQLIDMYSSIANKTNVTK